MTSRRRLDRRSLFQAVALSTVCVLLPVCGDAAEPRPSLPRTESENAPPQKLTAGVFTFEVPSGWEVLSGADERATRRETEESAKQMLKRFESDSGHQPDSGRFLGIQAFKAVRMPNRAGWFVAYTLRIPPQQDYLKTIEADQDQKLAWGKQQGIVSRVLEIGRKKIGEAEVFKVDLQMREGIRSIGFFYWAPSEPSLIGTIIVLINPGQSASLQSSVNAAIASLVIEKSTK